MDGWMDGWMIGWMDGWMDGWTDKCCLIIHVIRSLIACNADNCEF